MEQKNLKVLVQSVREVLRTDVSSNDISLVLQHFDFNIEKTVDAFLEGYSNEIICQWTKKNKKTSVERKRSKSHKYYVDGPYSTSSSADLSILPSSNVDWELCHFSRKSELLGSSNISYPSSSSLSSSLSLDSRSVSSDSGATVSLNSVQTTDSGCVTSTFILPVQISSTEVRDDCETKDVNDTTLNPLNGVISNPAYTSINTCFDLIYNRLKERQTMLVQKVDVICKEPDIEATFVCDLKQVLKAIDSFGQVVSDPLNQVNDPSVDFKQYSDPVSANPHSTAQESDKSLQDILVKDDESLKPSDVQVSEPLMSSDILVSSNPDESSHQTNEKSKPLVRSTKKKSKVKDRRSNKSSTLSTSDGIVEVSINDFIFHPKQETLPAVDHCKNSQQSVSDLQQDIAHKNYVFKQSDSLTRYEMTLKNSITGSACV